MSDGEVKLEKLETSPRPEPEDRPPSEPLVVPNRAAYAQMRAAGQSIRVSAKAARVHTRTAAGSWEKRDSPVGCAIQDRIDFLISSRPLIVPSAWDIMARMTETAEQAKADGKYEAAYKLYARLLDIVSKQAPDDAVPALGEDVTDDDLEEELG